MKVSRQQAAQHRERILDAAAALFRERGLDGIGVAELMKSAGLTHGGFYGHFDSKEALMAQACARALERSVEKWRGRGLQEIVDSYLSVRHRDHPGAGCAIAALGGDVPRQGKPVRRAFSDGLRALVDILARLVPGASAATRRRRALTVYSAMVGALMLARAVDDPELSEEILRSVAASLK